MKSIIICIIIKVVNFSIGILFPMLRFDSLRCSNANFRLDRRSRCKER